MITNEARPLHFQETLFPMPRKVLLAEGDAALREELADEIRGDGYEVIELADGLELVDYFQVRARGGSGALPDVVVAELALPGLSGLEACVRLRQLGAEVPFILISSSRALDVYADAERVGAAFVFEKPLNIDSLRNAVSSVAGGW